MVFFRGLAIGWSSDSRLAAAPVALQEFFDNHFYFCPESRVHRGSMKIPPFFSSCLSLSRESGKSLASWKSKTSPFASPSLFLLYVARSTVVNISLAFPGRSACLFTDHTPVLFRRDSFFLRQAVIIVLCTTGQQFLGQCGGRRMAVHARSIRRARSSVTRLISQRCEAGTILSVKSQ